MRPWLWLGLGLVACQAKDDRAVPTFNRDVAPLVWSHCAPCHRPGEAAPFALLDYDDVRRKRRQIVEVTQRRIMPPWLPRADQLPLQGARRLTDAEIATLAAWVDGGAPQGDPRDLPQRPVFPQGWQLREPDLVLALDQPYELPADGPDLFRNFVLPVPSRELRYVTALELRPGSAAVHHAIVQVDHTRSARRADANDPGPGFSGMAMAGSEPPDGHFLGWTLGKQVRPEPEGMAWRLHPGSDLVVQLHLTPTGKPETIRPRLGLYFTESAPTREPFSLTLFSEAIDIPAGDSAHVVRDHFVLPVAVRVLGFYPHAHYLGRRLRSVIRLPGGEVTPLFAIDAWDFDWQDDYRLVQPLDLPAGARIEFEYTYDNSASNPANPSDPPVRVKFGPRSVDEMATLTVTVLPADAAGRQVLHAATWRNTLRKKPWDWDAHLRLARVLRQDRDHGGALQALREALRLRPDYAEALAEVGVCLLELGRLDEAERAFGQALALDATLADAHFHRGRLAEQRGRIDAALRGYRAALTTAPEWVDVHVQLGTALARSGASEAAMGHFARAIELRPDIPEAHNNLGNALFSLARHAEAARAYRAALALRPDYFNARFNLGRVLMASGQRAAGRAELEQAARLRPDDPALRAALQNK